MRSFNQPSCTIPLLAVVFLILLLASCAKEPAPTPQKPNLSDEYLIGSLLTEKEAKSQAEHLYATLFQSGLRSISVPQVSSVQKIGGARGLDTISVPSAYVVNFGNNQGYIVLSESQSSSFPILMASPRGHLDPNKPIDNPNLIPIMTNLSLAGEKDNPRDRTDRGKYLIDSLGNRVNPPLYPDSYRRYGAWEVVEQHGPLLKIDLGQWDPYNMLLDPINGTLPPVGCVATAVVGIMSYHRYPDFLWDEIKKNPRDGYAKTVLPELFRELGMPYNLDMQYGLNGSGAPSKNVPRTLRRYGYQSNDLIPYDWAQIKSEISADRPVYIEAYSFLTERRKPKFLFWGGGIERTYDGGHAWVLDGLRVLGRKIQIVSRISEAVIETLYETNDLVYCNLGWSGKSNGYYPSGIFDTNKGPEMRSVSTSTYGQADRYVYNLNIITGIRR